MRQWVAAVGLISQAEEVSRGATSVDRATALILADTAAETALGLISSFSTDALPGMDHGTYLRRARERGRLPASAVTELQAVHKLRNGAVHQGAEVGPDDAQRAILAARTLIDVYVPRVLRSARALHRGAGVADAVGALMLNHPIGHRLSSAATALARRDDRGALEHTAAALRLVQIYAKPPLPSYGEGIMATLRRTTGHVDRDDLEWREEVENWLIPIALGLTPSAYGALRSFLPTATYIPGSKELGGRFYFNHRKEDPPQGAAKRSLETISHLALRLWLRDSLRFPANPPDQ